MDVVDRSKPPSQLLLAMEVRGIWEFQAFLAAFPFLMRAKRGDGHPVLVLPGLSASDSSTQPLRTYLKGLGYAAHGWRLGMNRGPRPGVEDSLDQRIAEIQARYGRKVSLIGWSLGGVLAREASHRAPNSVRQIITLGSPFASEPRSTSAWRLYEALSGRSAEDWPDKERMRNPPPVPSTSIYSRTDGVVAWPGSLERESATTQNIEVEGSHCGLGWNPAALYAIADRLAMPEGEWWPFDRSGARRFVYPDPLRAPQPGPEAAIDKAASRSVA